MEKKRSLLCNLNLCLPGLSWWTFHGDGLFSSLVYVSCPDTRVSIPSFGGFSLVLLSILSGNIKVVFSQVKIRHFTVVWGAGIKFQSRIYWITRKMFYFTAKSPNNPIFLAPAAPISTVGIKIKFHNNKGCQEFNVVLPRLIMIGKFPNLNSLEFGTYRNVNEGVVPVGVPAPWNLSRS